MQSEKHHVEQLAWAHRGALPLIQLGRLAGRGGRLGPKQCQCAANGHLRQQCGRQIAARRAPQDFLPQHLQLIANGFSYHTVGYELY